MTGRGPTTIRLAAIQAHALPGKIAANLEHAAELIEQAAGQGATTVVLPVTEPGQHAASLDCVVVVEAGCSGEVTGSRCRRGFDGQMPAPRPPPPRRLRLH
jgi:hypothetical protein